MNKKRLLKLAEFLEQLPRKKFHFGCWMDSENAINKFTEAFNIKKTTKDIFVICEPLHCKTVGCAMGWAATIPSFKKAGLKLYQDDHNSAGVAYFKNGILVAADGITAAELFFDIPSGVADALFNYSNHYGSSSSSVTPKQVAKQIKQYVKNGVLQ